MSLASILIGITSISYLATAALFAVLAQMKIFHRRREAQYVVIVRGLKFQRLNVLTIEPSEFGLNLSVQNNCSLTVPDLIGIIIIGDRRGLSLVARSDLETIYVIGTGMV
jgi:hypothetical protein